MRGLWEIVFRFIHMCIPLVYVSVAKLYLGPAMLGVDDSFLRQRRPAWLGQADNIRW